MQIIATGKWSKAEKRWKMVVALRRPTNSLPASATKPRDARRGTRAPRHPNFEN